MPQTPSFFIQHGLLLYNRLVGQRLSLRSEAASATQPVGRFRVSKNATNLLNRICKSPDEIPFILAIFRMPWPYDGLREFEDYANWLDRHGDMRADYVRAVVSAKVERKELGCISPETQQKERELALQMDKLWLSVFSNTISGKVTRITDSGIYVRLADDIEGEIHITDMCW